MQKRDMNAEHAPPPASPYSQAVEVTGASRILFISGQIGAEPDGTTPPSTAAQARLAWRNLAVQLAAAGMGFDNVVKVITITSRTPPTSQQAAPPLRRPWATAVLPAPLSSAA